MNNHSLYGLVQNMEYHVMDRLTSLQSHILDRINYVNFQSVSMNHNRPHCKVISLTLIDHKLVLFKINMLSLAVQTWSSCQGLEIMAEKLVLHVTNMAWNCVFSFLFFKNLTRASWVPNKYQNDSRQSQIPYALHPKPHNWDFDCHLTVKVP